MRIAPWKLVALAGVVLGACFVPALDELEQETPRPCDAEQSCLPGYACVEGACQSCGSW